MATLTAPIIFNWRCPTCRDWRGIGSMNEARRCINCGTRCEWTRYDIGQMSVADPADTAVSDVVAVSDAAVNATGPGDASQKESGTA